MKNFSELRDEAMAERQKAEDEAIKRMIMISVDGVQSAATSLEHESKHLKKLQGMTRDELIEEARNRRLLRIDH